MVKEIKVIEKKLNLTDCEFDIDKLYKGLKKKVENLTWDFAEKEQGKKSGKYGDEIKLTFFLGKDIDYFCKAEGEMEFLFENLKKTKSGKYKGDLAFVMKVVHKLDYKNRWGKRAFNVLILDIYLKLKKEEIKSMYVIPTITAVNEIYDYIKEQLEEYS